MGNQSNETVDPIIASEYQKRQNRRRLALIGFMFALLGGASLIAFDLTLPSFILLAIGFGLFIGFPLRCPSCNAGVRLDTNYCSNCSMQLQ
jgi:hypothetical protein